MSNLLEIINKPLSGEWGEDDKVGNGTPVIRTANFTDYGVINYKNIVTRNIVKKNIQDKYLKSGDIIIEKSGGSDAKPVGRVVYFDKGEGTYLFNNFTSLIRLKKTSEYNSKYVFYLLFYLHSKGFTRRFERKTTGLHNLDLDGYLRSIKVKQCPIEMQNKIVSNLDKINSLKNILLDALDKLDILVKSRFNEIFGNFKDKNWPLVTLADVADIVSGITKGRKTKSRELFTVPYMAVSNVKDGYIDWTNVKRLEVTKEEIEKYRILPNDILMTEGGDPDKLGRGTIIKTPPENCIHQNHIFRVRLDEDVLKPDYFSNYLQNNILKAYFLRSSKQTTGIASINMTQLRNAPVYIPPIKEQEAFIKVKEQVDKSKFAIEQSIEKLETLKASLMQEYFG